MPTPEELMRIAIDRAREGLARGQSPFGCAIALGDEIVAACHNRVFLTTDITAHAEVTALREACSHTGEITLEGALVATTCEPCPMCMSALHWARVDRVYYGATIADAQAAGFNELTIPARSVLDLGGSEVTLVPGVLEAECRALFEEWKGSAAARAY
ncbi:MAG: nucleoside deaminase [Planctomycetes bacterium]|nr:nucleoside deaminase [Planctomycetota bacterium]